MQRRSAHLGASWSIRNFAVEQTRRLAIGGKRDILQVNPAGNGSEVTPPPRGYDEAGIGGSMARSISMTLGGTPTPLTHMGGRKGGAQTPVLRDARLLPAVGRPADSGGASLFIVHETRRWTRRSIPLRTTSSAPTVRSLRDLLRQGFGFAAFVIPVTLVGWSLRLLLDRPLRSFWLKLGLLPVALILAALGLSVLDYSDASGNVGCGGVLGWGMQRLLAAAGFGSAGPAGIDDRCRWAWVVAFADPRFVLARLARTREWRQPSYLAGRGTFRARDDRRSDIRRQNGAAVVASALRPR